MSPACKSISAATAIALILANGVTEESYNLRFPLPYSTSALTPWQAVAFGLGASEQQWLVTSPFRYVSDKHGVLDVPAGATTDAASIPRLFEGIISRTDVRILRPSLVHDYLYSTCGKTLDGRQLTFMEVNEVLSEAMLYCGADAVIRAAVYEAVQLGGKAIWNAHNPPKGYEA